MELWLLPKELLKSSVACRHREGNYQSLCPGEEMKLSMWQPLHAISHGGLWASKLSVSASLERFRCRWTFSRIEIFILLGLSFLPNLVCFFSEGKKEASQIPAAE